MPQDGFLQTIRALCDEYNMAFILDEVITGFRLSLGGAQQFFNIKPDLCIFAKAIASGYPISAIAGTRKWMHLIEDAKVIHAGTMNSSNATVAAALATIQVLEKEQPYDRMFKLGKKLMDGIREAAAQTGHKLLVQGPGPMFNISFTDAEKVSDYRGTLAADKAKLGKFISAMHNEGIRIIGRGLWYISAVHTDDDINLALDKVREVLKSI